jgi:hypothetical protein
VSVFLSLSLFSGYKEWFRDVSYITSVIKIQSAGVESFMLFKYFARSEQPRLAALGGFAFTVCFLKKAAGALSKSRMPFLPIT